MKDQEIRTLDTLKRTNNFGAKYAADFPAASIGGQQFAKIAAAVTQTGALGAQQTSGGGDAHGGVLTKGTLRLLIHDDLAGINRAAHSLALLGTAGLEGKFRMPHSNGDQVLLNTARAFITEAVPLKAQMTQLNLPADTLDTLKTLTDSFEAALKTKSDAIGSQAAATAGIGHTVHDAVIALHVVDSIVRNTYKNDAAKLGEWTVASHVERAPQHPAKPAPAKPS